MPKHYYGVDDFLAHHAPREGRTLVAGSRVYDTKPVDRRSLYRNAVGIDMQPGVGVDVVHDMEAPLPTSLGTFDHVDCVSMLEHCRRPWRVAENVLAVMNPDATLLVSAPFVWRVHGYPSDYWRFTAKSFDVLFPGVEWQTRGYLMGSLFRKLVNHYDKNGKTYLQRAETIGFGTLRHRRQR